MVTDIVIKADSTRVGSVAGTRCGYLADGSIGQSAGLALDYGMSAWDERERDLDLLISVTMGNASPLRDTLSEPVLAWRVRLLWDAEFVGPTQYPITRSAR
jgi:hypothetical protein